MKPHVSILISILIACLWSCIGFALFLLVPTDALVGRAEYDANLPVIASVLAGIAFGIAGFRVSLRWFRKRQGTVLTRRQNQPRMSPLKWSFVGVNLLISAAAAFPSSLLLLPWGRTRWVGHFAVIAWLAGGLACELGYIASSFVIFSVCVLLLIPGIPLKSKVATALIEMTSAALLCWFTQRIRAQNPGCAIF